MSTQLDDRLVTSTDQSGVDTRPKNHIFCTKCNDAKLGVPYIGVALCGKTAPANGRRLMPWEKPPNPCPDCVRVDQRRSHRHRRV